MSNSKGIKIFITGGTFDKQYNPLTGQLIFKESNIPGMLDRANVTLHCSVEKLMMLDSLEMAAAERERVANHCVAADQQRIVITHGTDTMAETAKVIAEKVRDKTIVITGAMIPYALGKSDALFNLGAALAFVQMLPHGVYVVMNGQVFSWHNVHKNKELGIFEEKE